MWLNSSPTSEAVVSLMVAVVTSLPELVTTVAAVRIGAYDLAIGNLFGSNCLEN